MQIKSLLHGKEINLTSDNAVIKSTNFNVDKNGNMTCKNANVSGTITSNNATITGGSLTLNGNGGNMLIRVQKNNNNDTMAYIAPDVIAINNNAAHVELLGSSSNPGIDVSVDNSSSTNIKHTGITTPSVQIKGAGTVMYGKETGHDYRCHWTGSQLQFWVDSTNVGTLSDKRLKSEIQDIDEDFINIINEVEMKQFKVANRNGLVSFGILAQDLMEIFKKYNKNPLDYEIVQETQYKIDDETIYYTINYEQFLILKQKATDKKIEQLQEKVNKQDGIISDLIKRIETLEKGVNK